MSSIWGSNIKISLFGQSHGKAVGVTIHDFPTGVKLDMKSISGWMKRRSPGQDLFSTSRKEEDSFEILSGIVDEKTTGEPLTAVIYNKDIKSQDYEDIAFLPRPSHADYAAHIRYGGHNDKRGGGHFSGRLTAGLVFAGGVCEQVLEKKGVVCGAHIKSIKDIEDKSFDLVNVSAGLLRELRAKDFPVIDDKVGNKMKQAILFAREKGDSVGGVIECAIVGFPAGLGDPMFDGVENKISSLIFGIPAIKGIEFGRGFDISKIYGSQANDDFYIEHSKVKTHSNNNGGINGGITNGMPIVFRVAVKPTPSIFKEQNTVNLKTMQNAKITIQGRHDPCIVKRAVPVVEAAANIAALDLILGDKRWIWT